MREEHVTKAILKWLIENHWKILCYDFPQSGTGKILHPNGKKEEKNKDAIIPDIVAVKEQICIFLENKDHFCISDYQKQNGLITDTKYSEAIHLLLRDEQISHIYYGIGMPAEKYGREAEKAENLIDFSVCVREDRFVEVSFNPHRILF